MAVPEPRRPVPWADMSPAEKLAAEREARHDVLARGHHADPLVLQHYLAHARAEEVVRRGGSHAARRPGTSAAPRPPAATRDAAAEVAPAPAPADAAGSAQRVPAGARHAPWWRRFRGR